MINGNVDLLWIRLRWCAQTHWCCKKCSRCVICQAFPPRRASLQRGETDTPRTKHLTHLWGNAFFMKWKLWPNAANVYMSNNRKDLRIFWTGRWSVFTLNKSQGTDICVSIVPMFTLIWLKGLEHWWNAAYLVEIETNIFVALISPLFPLHINCRLSSKEEKNLPICQTRPKSVQISPGIVEVCTVRYRCASKVQNYLGFLSVVCYSIL